MYGFEQKLCEQIETLQKKYDLAGIKAEFEAEGSTFRDLMRLRRLTLETGTKLFLKIGGVEAIRDIKDAIEIGVDGIIAPMCESTFGLQKFISSCEKYLGNMKLHLSVNVETRAAAESIDSILEHSKGCLDNITIGRTDLTGSYFDKSITPDSDFIFDLVESILDKVRNTGITLTMGGSITAKTLEKMKKRPTLVEHLYKLETRKVILPAKKFVFEENAINEALKFEELYILSKKDYSDLYIASDINRLAQLKKRKEK